MKANLRDCCEDMSLKLKEELIPGNGTLSDVVSQYLDTLFPLMTPFDVKLDFHPVAHWVVNGDVVHGPLGRPIPAWYLHHSS